jgi:hypothetical protein
MLPYFTPPDKVRESTEILFPMLYPSRDDGRIDSMIACVLQHFSRRRLVALIEVEILRQKRTSGEIRYPGYRIELDYPRVCLP